MGGFPPTRSNGCAAQMSTPYAYGWCVKNLRKCLYFMKSVLIGVLEDRKVVPERLICDQHNRHTPLTYCSSHFQVMSVSESKYHRRIIVFMWLFWNETEVEASPKSVDGSVVIITHAISDKPSRAVVNINTDTVM